MLLALPVALAISSCVNSNSLFSRSYPLASSTGFRSSLCKFSISAASRASWSSFWFTREGIVFSPAIFEALTLLSPAITSNLSRPTSRTRIGDKTPCFLIDSASSWIFTLSNSWRGWYLPAVIFYRSISFVVVGIF